MSVPLSARVRDELSVWLDLETHLNGALWIQPQHTMVRIETDASSRRWGGVIKAGPVTEADFEVGGDFPDHLLDTHINEKECYALVCTFECFLRERGSQALSGARIVAAVDNLVLHASHKRGGGRNLFIVDGLRKLFWLQVEGNFYVTTTWIPTHINVHADGITREDIAHDRRLSSAAVVSVFHHLGTPCVDWCASDANSLVNPFTGVRLPFVSQYYCPDSAGVDVLSHDMSHPPGGNEYGALGYVFPPVPLVGAVVHHAKLCHACVILVVEDHVLTGPARAAILAAQVQRIALGKAGSKHALLEHEKNGRLVFSVLKSTLWAFKLQF